MNRRFEENEEKNKRVQVGEGIKTITRPVSIPADKPFFHGTSDFSSCGKILKLLCFQPLWFLHSTRESLFVFVGRTCVVERAFQGRLQHILQADNADSTA